MNKAEKQAAAASLRNEATVLRQTRENYKEARANIEEKIKVLAEREQTKSVIWQRQYQEALKAQLDTAIDALSTKNYSNIRQYLEGEYENGFIGTMYSMQKQGIPLAMPIDQKRVVKMVETGGDGIKLSKRLYGQTTKLKNAVRREVSIGLASGESYQDIAGRLSRTMGVDYNKTVRIARTEGGRVQNGSRFDAMTSAKKSGADIVKQWDSTLDNRTRTAHRELDGQIRELEDFFEAEGQQAQHPHGFGVAWMDVNCRCVVVQRARWAIDGSNPEFEDYTKFSRYDEFDREAWVNGTLAEGARKNGGQVIDLLDSRNFGEFKKRYKDVSNNLIAQAAAAEIGVEVMGEAIPEAAVSVDEEVKNALAEAYERRRIADGLNLTPVEELKEIGMFDKTFTSNLGNLSYGDEVAKQFQTLAGRYRTTATSVRTVTKNDFLFNGLGTTAHHPEMGSSEIILKPWKREKLVKKISTGVQDGFFFELPEQEYAKYLITHEFGHTLMHVGSKAKNYVGIDEKMLRKAKKEIKDIFKEYKVEVTKLTSEIAKLEESTKGISDIDELMKAMKKLGDKNEKLRSVKISDYSLTDEEEFLAEAFAQSEIGLTQSKYSKKVMQVVKRYFAY